MVSGLVVNGLVGSGMARLGMWLAAWVAVAIAAASPAHAAQPTDWHMGLQEPATAIKRQLDGFHDILLGIIFVIALFVLALLIFVMVRFNAKANPNPSKLTHNSTLEVLWTVVPVLILVGIAIPSFRLLYAQYEFPKADLVVKTIGYQWYWGVEYPDNAKIAFDQIMLEDKELKPGQPRLLAVDNDMVVPVNKVVHVLVTAADVMHAWTIPAFGVKADAVPGRINKTWFKAEKPGAYYGQCSELCGTRHAFMPIAVRVVTEPVYQRWLTARAEGGDDAAREVIRTASVIEGGMGEPKLAGVVDAGANQ